MSDNRRLQWNLDHRQVLPEDFEHKAAVEALVFELPFHNMHSTPSSFSDFDSSRKVPVVFEALLQLFVHAINRIDLHYTTLSDKSALRSDTHMLNVYVETLLWDVDAERPENANVREREFVHEQLVRMCRDRGLFEGNNEQLVSARVRALRFMSALRDREAYGVRLWFVSRDSNVSIAKYMGDLLMENFARSQKEVEHDGLKIEDRAFQARVKLTGEADGGDVTAITNGNEVFRRIPNLHEWATVVGMYTNDEKLANDTFHRSSVLQAREAFTTSRHTLNPACVFDRDDYFKRIRNNKRVDRRQRNLSFYKTGAHKLRFPYPSAVLMVDPAHMSVDKFRRLYLPTYQLAMIEPAKDGSLANSIALARAHNAAQEAIARDEGREVDPNLLINAIDHIELSGDELSDEPHGLFFESPEEAERARDGGEHNAAGNANAADASGDDSDRMEPDDAERLESFLGTVDHRPATQQRLERQFNEVQTGSGAPKQETHRLRDRFMGEILPSISGLAERTERRHALMQMRRLAIDEYVAKCQSTSSDISTPSRAIVQWASNMRKEGAAGLKFRGDYRMRDPSLSFFGNFMTIMWERTETCLAAFTAHSTFWLVFMSSLTSFRYRLGLHGNLIIYGPPGTSKSWPLEQMALLIIKGTFEELSSTTDRAGDVDENDNDKTVLFHEVPHHIITGGSGSGGGGGGGGGKQKGGEKGGGGASSACDEMKNSMTAGLRSRATCDITGADGKRRTRRIISEQQKSFVLCTNAGSAEMDSAFKSRCVMLYLVSRERADGVSIEERQADEGRIDRSANSEFGKFAHDIKMLQMGVHDIEKLIKIAALPEPTLGVLAEVYGTYKKTLLDKFGINLQRRQFAKVRIYVRQHVVLNALVWLYLTPTSPCFGREYAVEHLLLLQPMLKDSVEIVFFVLDLLRDEFIQPTQRAVRAALRTQVAPKMFEKQRAQARREFGVAAQNKQRVLPLKMFQPTLGNERDRAFSAFQRTLSFAAAAPAGRGVPSGVGTSLSSIRSPEQRMAQSGLPRGSSVAAPAVDGGGGGGAAQQAATTAADRALQAEEYDPNYVHFGGTIYDVAKLIAADTDCLPEFSDRLSVDVVKEELDAMSKRRVYATGFRMNSNGEAFPPVQRSGNKVQPYAAAKRVGPRHEFCIHSELVFGTEDDPHEQAIISCLSAYEEPARYVAGRPPRESMPFLLKVRQIGPQRGTYENRSRRGADGEKISMIGTSLDKMCTGEHLRKLCMFDSAANRARYDSVCLSRVSVDKHRFVVDEAIDYPTDLVVEAQARLNAKRRARDFNARATQRDVLDRARTGEVAITGMPEDDDDEGDDFSESFGGAAHDFLAVERDITQRVASAAVNQKSTFDSAKPIESYLEPQRDHHGCEIDEFGDLLDTKKPVDKPSSPNKRSHDEMTDSASDDGEFDEQHTNHALVGGGTNDDDDDDDLSSVDVEDDDIEQNLNPVKRRVKNRDNAFADLFGVK